MKETKNRVPRERGSRADFIRVTETLIAKRGVHGVGIREIVSEVGHKNVASVRYHFGSKENLIREIMVDGLRRSDEWRMSKLDKLERSPDPITIRDVILIIVGPAHKNVVTKTFNLFLSQVRLADQKLFDDVLNREGSASMKRCIDLLKDIAGRDGDPTFDNRIALLSMYLWSFIDVQSWANYSSPVYWRKSVNWSSPELLEEFIATCEGMLLTRFPGVGGVSGRVLP
jgi:AcrR family transcriptional regulator